MTMTMTICLVFLLLLQCKHWIVDFVLQKESVDPTKKLFFNSAALAHSMKHGMGTFIVGTLLFPAFGIFTLGLGIADAILHHIIDWGKTKVEHTTSISDCGNFLVGCDQLMHQICYIGYAVSVIWVWRNLL
jgi:ABC-type phosphate transport system permease subunit